MEEEALALEKDVVVEDVVSACIVRKGAIPKKTITLSMTFLTRQVESNYFDEEY